MHGEGFFYQALIYLAAAVISVPIAKRLGLGSVLGYLIAGVIIGPFGLHLIGEEGQDVLHFSEFGVVMMLFLIGLELKPSLLWKMRIPILGLGGVQVGISAIIIAAIGLFVGLTFKSALAIGLTLALSSTALVLQTLNEKNLSGTTGGKNIFSVLLFQDIAIIPILAFMPLLASEAISSGVDAYHAEDHTWTAGFPVWGKTLTVIAAISLIIVAGRYLVTPAFRLLAKTRLRELFTAAALLLVISIAMLMIKVGLSPALGTFLAGVILAQSEFRHELETDIEPFKGLLLGLFFIAVGASIDFQLVGSMPGQIAMLVGALIIVKFIVLFVIAWVYGMGLDNKFFFAFSLAQGGEFAFVLFSFAVSNNVLESGVANTLIAAVALTMAITPLLMLINEKLIQPRFGTKEKEEREADEINEENPIIIAGFGRMGSVIGRFIQACGLSATYLDLDPDNVDFLRKLGLQVYYGDASRFDLLKAARAGHAKTLIIAVKEPEKIIQIAETAQKHFPHLKIYSRASGWGNIYDLYDIEVEHVYKDTFDTAIRIAEDAVSDLGLRKYQVNRLARKFASRDEKAWRDFAKTRRDSKSYLHEVRQHFEDLENLMIQEQTDAHKDKDLGWDPQSLIEEFKEKSKKQ